MVNRRQLLGALSWPAAAAYGGAFLSPARRAHALTVAERLATHPGAAGELADDEYFWYDVRQAFSAEAGIINLNSGGVSPSPLPVQDAMKRYLDYSNTSPTYAMWQILEPQREQIRERLAMEWDTDAEELALVRNASEGLQICQFGIDLEPGDEILTTNQDYGRMITTYKQRERREGVVLKQISVPVPADDDDAIVRLFESNITPRTRIIHMCHMINLTGQILPVAKVTNMARRRGIPVIVDGAHTLAHFDFKISDLECDYYATSLHKWLFAPHGTGLLYVRRDKIRDLWPLMAAHERNDENIRKFEEIGTHPAANYLAIGDALTFHQGIGAKRKEARLVYLRDHWANRLQAFSDRVYLNTSQAPGKAAGIANVGVEGIDTSTLNDWLWTEHRIITVAINHAEFTGLRISPSVFTTLEELDRFCDAIEQAVKQGISA
ncbi:MAG TPA: aminotransferase class V-fold PLP-dependent enzyme [Acidobacteriota bacterium]|nr:aminotransferase class V-fold PLP-dependent enzyme [Acidobacteriota bacterium]